MDSRSLRLPFCLSTSSPRASASSTSSSSSTSVGSSRLYSRETLPQHDRFPRASSTYKVDVDQKRSHLLSSSRDYNSADFSSSGGGSRSSSSRKSLTSSTRSFDHPWVESSVSSRTKVTDLESRFGRPSLLTSTDDGDNKRAKLTNSNRGLYSKTSSTSLTGSTYSSSGFNTAKGIKEKRSNSDMSWSSSHFLSRSSASCSKTPLSSREAETPNESGLSGLRDRRTRIQELTSSLYQTDRLTSTYAQGARPKDSAYLSCSFTAERKSSPGGQVASTSSTHRFSTPRDYNNRPSARFLNASSSSASFQEKPSSRRPKAPLSQRPTHEDSDPQRRTSTRHLLSRLFASHSSQDSPSSSSSSSVRSFDDDSLSLDSDEGTRISGEAEIASHSWQPNSAGTRQDRVDLSPILEDKDCGVAGATVALPRESEVGSRQAASGGNSWLSSSLRSRCPSLLPRLHRRTQDESAHSTAGLSRPQHLLRRLDELERRVPQNDEEDDDDEEEQGAVGSNRYGAARPRRQEEDKLPQMEETLVGLARGRRGAPLQNRNCATAPQDGAERMLDAAASKQEKLRIIKERLMLEDSDEDEGDLCRICHMREESASNPLIQPCRCTGSLQYVHEDCIKRWLCSKIGSGTNLEAITKCELCKEKLRLNINNFDFQQLYRTHAQFKYDDFISSGLYLVVLLHFFEQRFADVLGAIYAAGILPRSVTTGNKMADLLSTSPIWMTIWTRNTDNHQLVAHGKILEHFFDILDIVAVGRNPCISKITIWEIKKTKL